MSLTPILPQWESGQAHPDVVVNANFKALQHIAVYANNPDTTELLTWGYLDGRWGGFAVTKGTLTLTASTTNYIVVARATGVISVSTATTNWDNAEDYARVYLVSTGASGVTAVEDHRAGEGGIFGNGGSGSGAGATPAPLITDATSARDVTPADAGSYIRFTATGAKTATFDSTDGFAATEEYHIANRAATDNLTLVGTGVALNAPKGGTLVLEPGDTVTIKFISGTEADVFGSTEAA